MKAKQLLQITLVVLLSVGLLFGGSIHGSIHHHGDGHGMDDHGHEESSPCHLCDLTLATVDSGPALHAWTALVRLAPSLAPPEVQGSPILSSASPRAPPA